SVKKTRLAAGADVDGAIVTPAGTLLAVGPKGIFRSTDAGRRFKKIAATGLTAIECFSDGRVVTVGKRGLIQASTDDGRTFRRIDHNVPLDGYGGREPDFMSCIRYGEDIIIGGSGALLLRLPGAFSVGSARAREKTRPDLPQMTRAALAHSRDES